MGCGASLPAVATPAPLPQVPGTKQQDGKVEPAATAMPIRVDAGDGARQPVQRKYSGAPRPLNEVERLQALHQMGVLNSKPQKFEEMVDLLQTLFETAMASVSLVDEHKQWFLSERGLHCKSTDRQLSFCAWTLLPRHPEVLIIEDATQDQRFVNNPVVTGPPFLRSYFGAPILSSLGHRLGSLCVLSPRVGSLDAESCNLLCNLAEVTARELERQSAFLHRTVSTYMVAEQSGAVSNAQAVKAAYSSGLLLVDTAKPRWPVLFYNSAFTEMSELAGDSLKGAHLWDLFVTEDEAARQLAAAQGPLAPDQDLIITATMTGKCVSLHLRPACNGALDERMLTISIPGGVQQSRDPARLALYFATVREQPQGSVMNFRKVGRDAQPIEGMKLGQLMFKTQHGKLYRGRLLEEMVMVKIAQDPDGDVNKPALEAVLSAELEHPNIARYIKHACRPRQGGSMQRRLYGHGRPTADLANSIQRRTLESTRNSLDSARASADLPSPGPAAGTRVARSTDSHVHVGGRGTSVVETWIVREYCDQGSLQDAIDQGRLRCSPVSGPDLKVILAAAVGIAAAVHYLHGRGIIVAHLSGYSIFLSSTADGAGWVPKLADFEYAVHAEQPYNRLESLPAEHRYLPPEALERNMLTTAADIYAFGVLLWELVTGQKPWMGLTDSEVFAKVVTSQEQLLFPRDTPAPIVALARDCTAHDLTCRPSTAALLRALERLQAAAQDGSWSEVDTGKML